MTSDRPDRWLALDVFRALAVLWMIQGHTFTALLAPAHYTGAWVQAYSLLHGLTAPMFLVGAGLAYGLVASLADTSARSAALRGRLVRRALLLFAIGTALQLPAASPAGILRERELLAGSLRLGALQLIAGCLLACELLRALWPRRWALVSGLLCAGLALCSPWIWNARASERALLGTWLDGHAGSLFPLAPWACFFLAAAAFAGLLGRRRPPAFWLMFGGFALSAGCYAFYRGGFSARCVRRACVLAHQPLVPDLSCRSGGRVVGGVVLVRAAVAARLACS
jgi:Heparan-alpha-glucosaminide N-acetyltransferase, catalytic